MIKHMVLIKAKDGMSRDAFRSYYENNHAPMARRLFPMFADYKRNYIEPRNARVPASAGEIPFDVITEMHFASEQDYAAFVEKRSRPEIRDEVLADEAKFMNQDRIFSFLVHVD